MPIELMAVVCLALLPTFSFAQEKALPSPPKAGIQPAIDSICDGLEFNFLHAFGNCGFETGDFSNWVVGGDPAYVGISADPVNSGGYAASFGAVGDFNILNSSPVALLSGFSYHVEFWLTNPNGGSGTEVQVYWFPSANDDPISLLDLTDSDPFDWTLFTFGPLPVTGDGANLSFAFRHDPAYFYLDDVDIEGQQDQ